MIPSRTLGHRFTPPPGITQVGDSPCCLLPDGRFLLGSFNSTSVFTFNPTNGTWSAVATKGDSGSEESWILMPEGTVLSPQCNSAPAAEKYDIQSNARISAGTLVSNIVETASLEIGPGILLTDKRAFFIGAAGGVSAIYQEGRTSTSTGTWSAGPVIPKSASGQSQGSKDGPAVLLPTAPCWCQWHRSTGQGPIIFHHAHSSNSMEKPEPRHQSAEQ